MNLKEKDTQAQLPLINEKIRAPQLQVIDHNGVNVGVLTRREALDIAEDADLDLVLLAEDGGAGVPVAKIMDFGKAVYEKKKKKAEARKHQKVIKVKELKLRPKIGEHDFNHKLGQFIEFIKDGMRVKVTISFRGRENISKESLGQELFKRVENAFNEHGIGRNIGQEGDSRMGQSWSRVYFLKKV
jgi:translation initiation factor IF-3